MAPAKGSGGKSSNGDASSAPPPQQREQEQLDCWACDATVAVPINPGTGRPALAFSCGWCGAVTRVEEEEEQEATSRDQGGERQRRRRFQRDRRRRLSAPRRLLARLLLPLASALSIAAATVLGVGWVLPALFDEARHPWLLLAADALAAAVSFNVALHFAALLAQAAGAGSGRGPKRVVVAAAGVGRTPEDEDTASVSFSGDSGAAFSGGGGSVVSGGGGGGGAAAAAVFVGSSVPRGAYAGHERCELCVEAAARRSSEEKERRRWRSGESGREILAASQMFRPFPAAVPPPPPRASFSSWRKRGHRPPGAAHCLVCDACVADVDHHCSFVGTCVSLRAGGGKGGERQQEEGSGRRRQPRHHPSGRHFALLLFWLLAGSAYAVLGSAALLVSRRVEVGRSWTRATTAGTLRCTGRRAWGTATRSACSWARAQMLRRRLRHPPIRPAAALARCRTGRVRVRGARNALTAVRQEARATALTLAVVNGHQARAAPPTHRCVAAQRQAALATCSAQSWED